MQFSFFIGIDVSKKTLDLAVRDHQQHIFHLKADNTTTGLDQFIAECITRGVDLSQSLFCCEHTGIYNQHLLDMALQYGYALWLESSLRIKRSMGLTRGKNDKIDSTRISEYAFRYADRAVAWSPERQVLMQLKQMVALRKRLLIAKNMLKVPLQEVANFNDKKLNRELEKLNKRPIIALEKQIKEVEKKIRELIKEDEILNHLFSLVTSVAGVGEVTFWEIITTTNEFKLFTCPKKYACYAGVAPFEHSSGTSIRGGTRVSPLANKQVKTLLHLAAMSAISKQGELADYYHRKVEAGKKKMSVLNAVRNKLIHRVFACVRENRKYEKNYINALA